MQNKAIEIFYLFFQGILTFQVLIFFVLYIMTNRKDLLYYSLFLLFAATYFFINAPNTFFGIPEDVVWNSAWYSYINTPVIIIENLFYLLFLKTFFDDITKDNLVSRVFRYTLLLIPFLFLLFILLTVLQINKQMIFYTVKLIAVIPAIVVAFVVVKKKLAYATLVVNGLLCTIAGTFITVCMIALGNYGVHHLFTDVYPLFFIRAGLLGDMIFYLVAILKKWHFQEKQLAIEKLQSQLAIEQIRNKISGELHDDFGSTLSGISMYSYMIGELIQTGKYEQAKQSAGVIQKSANDMAHNLGDLVWAINPNHDSLQKLVQRLEEYAQDMAAAKNVQLYLNIPAHSNAYTLPVESRRNVYLFCKEAINNAIKYSDCTLLQLNVIENNGTLNFIVSDNGKGFNSATVKHGNGLENMQKRAEEIGAAFLLQSEKKTGSVLSLQIKIT